MDTREALKLAISALNSEADDTYEGDELLEPDIKAWVDARHDAAEELGNFLKTGRVRVIGATSE